MKIGLWNIDHPEAGTNSKRKQQRFEAIKEYLQNTDCDMFILNEANAALELDGYTAEFSQESPFISKSRSYEAPNKYHQVGIYSNSNMQKRKIHEPINGLCVRTQNGDTTLSIYGNVVTLKDQWSKTSNLKYSDRLEQQIEVIEQLPDQHTLIAGDFNLRLGWPQRKGAHNRLKEAVSELNLHWPTRERKDTVQHVIHTPDLNVSLDFDFSVKYDEKRSEGLSDHPFAEIRLNTD